MTPQQATTEVMQHFVANISGLELREKIKQTITKAMECRAPAPTEPAADRDAVLEEVALYCDQVMKDRFGAAKYKEAYGAEYLAACIRAIKLATPASPAVPVPAPLARKPAMSMFATMADYRASIASFDKRMADPLTRIIVEQTGNFPVAPQLPQASQPTSAPSTLTPVVIPEPGYSDSLADRIFNLPCKWKGDARLADAVLMGHTMACEQAFMLAYAASQPTSAPGSILVRITSTSDDYDDVHPDLILEDAMRVNPYGWPNGFTFEVVQPTSAEGKDGDNQSQEQA